VHAGAGFPCQDCTGNGRTDTDVVACSRAAGPHSAKGADREMRTWLLRFLTAVVVTALAAPVALAALGQPTPWQIGLQDAATPVMHDIVWIHNFVMVIITAIAVFVLILLVTVMLRFNARCNPVPSKTTHNTAIEVAWTLIPVKILVAIAVPSFKLLFVQQNIPQADLT